MKVYVRVNSVVKVRENLETNKKFTIVKTFPTLYLIKTTTITTTSYIFRIIIHAVFQD